MTQVLSSRMPGDTAFNVLSYGAKPDGTTDNSAAFNACFAAAGTYAASNGGATVVIPPGRYKVIAPVTQEPNCTYYAYGAYVFNGDAFDTANWHMFNIAAGTGYTGDSHITWLGGTFDAKGQNCPVSDTNAKNIFLIGQGYNYRFEDVTMRNVASWHAIDSGAINGLIVNRCRFEGWVDKSVSGTANGTKEAIQIQEGTDETKAKNISITNCYMGPAIDGSGLNAHPVFCGSHTMPTGTTFDNLVVSGNLIESAQYAGIRFYGVNNAVIANNVISVGSGTTWGIQLTVSFNQAATSRRVIITGNSISAFGNTGIYVLGQDTNNATAQEYNTCIISDNVIAPSSAVGSGITTWYLRDTMISNNVIDGVSGTGIFLDDESNRCVVTGNKISNVGVHGIQVDLSDDCDITNNQIYNAGGNGVFVANASLNTTVSGNNIRGAGHTAGTWAGVRLSNTAITNTNISNNRFRKFGSSPEATNPIIIDGTTPTGTVILNNDFGTEWSSNYLTNITTNGAAFRDNGKIRYKRKSGSQNFTTITAGDVTDLGASVDANSTYVIEVHIYSSCSGTGGLQTTWTVPSGTTLNRFAVGSANQTTSTPPGYANRSNTAVNLAALAHNSGVNYQHDASGNGQYEYERMIVTTGGTAGTIQLQGRQITANGTTTITTDSYIAWSRIDI